MPADPTLSTAEELAALPREEPAARLADAYRLISELSVRVERLERQAARDSAYRRGPRRRTAPIKEGPGSGRQGTAAAGDEVRHLSRSRPAQTAQEA